MSRINRLEASKTPRIEGVLTRSSLVTGVYYEKNGMKMYGSTMSDTRMAILSGNFSKIFTRERKGKSEE